jgi:uncharacterized protein (TIGR02270 family)
VTPSQIQRPVGFAPMEISALVNRTVVTQHAEEAAFLWWLRNRAVAEPHYSLQDVAGLDARIKAHLEGLQAAGESGWSLCHANLANVGPGEVFPLAILAFSAGARPKMLEVLNIACDTATIRSGLISALGWLDRDVVAPWIGDLVEARNSAHRLVGVAASAVHRADPGSALDRAVDDSDSELRARSLRAVGELKRADLLARVHRHIEDGDDECRFWAAWSLTLHRESSGLAGLLEAVERNDSLSQCALQLSLRAMTPDRSRGHIRSLAESASSMKLAVIGAGILGDPTSVPWLIKKMESPGLARVAGESFTMITGVDLSYHDLDGDPPAVGNDDEVSIEQVLDLDYESNLPWPEPARVGSWWHEHQQRFALGTRYLAGEPISLQSAHKVLRTGKQRQRAAAALEVALLEPGEPLFEVRAPGSRQQEQLGLATW